MTRILVISTNARLTRISVELSVLRGTIKSPRKLLGPTYGKDLFYPDVLIWIADATMQLLLALFLASLAVRPIAKASLGPPVMPDDHDPASADVGLMVAFLFKFSHQHLAQQVQLGGLVLCMPSGNESAPNVAERTALGTLRLLHREGQLPVVMLCPGNIVSRSHFSQNYVVFGHSGPDLERVLARIRPVHEGARSTVARMLVVLLPSQHGQPNQDASMKGKRVKDAGLAVASVLERRRRRQN
ncbi:uncharacterized protein LOC117645504 [Thrips palmi]|uniref:Uncharacterized protein LOC117645504 n=1 Tax=Thrips palmi TaxID=161013 RepID=A0A6P8YWL1_THRPL|nr:uncharacterized protein LOC117645504 [Thrips palmi]